MKKVNKLNFFRSPNFDERFEKINMIVIHYTGMNSFDEAKDHLCNKNSKVSAHYLIDEIGKIYQLVDDIHRAWHAGVSIWKNKKDINSCSIGIELVNPGHEFGYKSFEEKQMFSIEHLLEELIFHYDIPLSNVVGHSDVAPLRKLDPGELFDWKRLAAKKLAVWPQTFKKNPFELISFGDKGEHVTYVQLALKFIGYGIEVDGFFGKYTEAVIKAFQRRFRQSRIDGFFDDETGLLLAGLKNLNI